MHLQVKLGVASVLDKLGVLNRLRRSRSHCGLILTFHRVLPDTEIDACYERHIAMRASVFAKLLEVLAAEYEIVPLELMLEGPAAKLKDCPQLALTFDDGWEDTCSVVCPMLAERHIPATVFLCSSLMSGDPHSMLPEERFARVWQAAAQQTRLPQLLRDLETWRVAEGLAPHMHAWARRLKHLPLEMKLMMLAHLEHIYAAAVPSTPRFLTWDQARRMHAQGISFGSHTARHASLNAEEPSMMLEELISSREAIARETGAPCTMLAYPNGAYDTRVQQAAQQAGYRYAFTTERGFVSEWTDPLAIPRLSMADPVVEGGAGLHLARTRLYLQQLGHVRRQAHSPTRRLRDLRRLQAAQPFCLVCEAGAEHRGAQPGPSADLRRGQPPAQPPTPHR